MGLITLLRQYKVFTGDERYKVVYGGRGKGATWQIARMLLYKAQYTRCRVLCTREFQNSINESVYYTLISQIEELHLGGFKILKNEIQHKNGSQFIFKGLRHNIDSIKSIEAITDCWVAEADKVPQDSWDKLIPTIRKEGSKFWIDFNTDSVTDPVYKMFVERPRDDVALLFQMYSDNKFFPDVLRAEMEYCKEYDYEKYLWVWEGQPRSFSNLCIFNGKYEIRDFETPSNVEFYHGIDWGFAQDPTVAVRCFIRDGYLYIDMEAGGVGIDIDETPRLLDKIPTLRTWTSIADSARPETISYMKHHGFPRMKGAKKGKGSIEDGIEFIKSFKKIIIHPRCKGVIEEFKTYRYKTNSVTGEIIPVPEDKNNHYCLVGDTQVITDKGNKRLDQISIGDMVLTRKGYKVVEDSFFAGVKKTYLVNGVLQGTADHKIFTQKGFTRIDELEIGDILTTANNQVRGIIESVIETDITKTYDITVADEHEFFANGILVSNCDSLRYSLETARRSKASIIKY